MGSRPKSGTNATGRGTPSRANDDVSFADCDDIRTKHGGRRQTTEIAQLTSAMGLSWDVREQVGTLYRQAMTEGFVIGRSIEEMAATCVYAVCWCAGRRQSPDEVVAVA